MADDTESAERVANLEGELDACRAEIAELKAQLDRLRGLLEEPQR